MDCKICNNVFQSEKALHGHIKRDHGLDQAGYYCKYFPRRDKFSSEKIPFKNKEQYFSTDFLSRTNLLKYLESLPTAARRVKIVELFKERKEKKSLSYIPSQVELRSLLLPSINFLQRHSIDYNSIAKEVGLINRFDYDIEFTDFPIAKDLLLVQDTREQKPLDFLEAKVTISGLNFGDYTCKSNFKNVFFERKSAMDLIGTLSSGFERFKQEINRAKEMDAYLIVLCEQDISTMLKFSSLDYFSRKTKVTSEYLFHNIRDIMQSFNNIVFGFCKDRDHMSVLISQLASYQGDIRKLDIQYLIDSKLV